MKTSGFGRALRAVMVACAAAGAGCAGQVEVESSVPTPVIAAMPLSVGVVYTDEFRTYSYTEDLIEGPEWTIELGNANVALFDQTLPSIFEQVVHLEQAEGASGIDALLIPEVDEFAFLTPKDAGVDFYSVSIRYIIEMYTADGDLLGSWPINAYGRVRSKLLKPKDSLSDAVGLAMRDAAAALAVDFREREMVRNLLSREQPES